MQAARFVTDDESLQEEILREVVSCLLKENWEGSPPELARNVHKIVRKKTGNPDPYRQVKIEANRNVLEMYPNLQQKVKRSPDPVLTATRLAIAGNIIDLGACDAYDLRKTIEEVLVKPFMVNHYDRFITELMKARSMIYLADNSGEVVFDRLLVETILEHYEIKKVMFVVKGAPIINDATITEAKEAGLDRIPEVEFSRMGTGAPGSGPVRESKEFGNFLDTGDMVISKGQGNFEGLSDRKDVFFLLMAKCPLVASQLGVETGDIILKGGER